MKNSQSLGLFVLIALILPQFFFSCQKEGFEGEKTIDYSVKLDEILSKVKDPELKNFLTKSMSRNFIHRSGIIAQAPSEY